MELSPKLTIHSTDRRKFKYHPHPPHHIRSPQIKDVFQQQKQQNAYKFMETRQPSTEGKLGKSRNKREIKDFLFLEFSECTVYPN